MIVTSPFFFSSMFIHRRSHWLTVGAVMHAPAAMSMSLSTGINVRVPPLPLRPLDLAVPESLELFVSVEADSGGCPLEKVPMLSGDCRTAGIALSGRADRPTLVEPRILTTQHTSPNSQPPTLSSGFHAWEVSLDLSFRYFSS